MLIIANAYRKLNMWNASAGASFEWVGRAINPYLGFLTGWLMVAAYVLGTLSGAEVLAPSVLSVFGSNSTATWGNIGIDTALGLIMIVIAVIGIKLTARPQKTEVSWCPGGRPGPAPGRPAWPPPPAGSSRKSRTD